MDPAQPQASSDPSTSHTTSATQDTSIPSLPTTTPVGAVLAEQTVATVQPPVSTLPSDGQPIAPSTPLTVSQPPASATPPVPEAGPQLNTPQLSEQPAPVVNTPVADPAVVVAMPVVQVAATQPQMPAAPVGNAVDKERVGGSTIKSEHLQAPEVSEVKEVEPDVEKWLEEKEQAGEIKIPEAIKDEHGAVVLDNAPATAVHDQVVVPMSHQGMIANKKQPVDSAAKWLAYWVERISKMFGDRVKFKDV